MEIELLTILLLIALIVISYTYLKIRNLEDECYILNVENSELRLMNSKLRDELLIIETDNLEYKIKYSYVSINEKAKYLNMMKNLSLDELKIFRNELGIILEMHKIKESEK